MNQTVLKIRFILLEKAIVMEVLEHDGEALGNLLGNFCSDKPDYIIQRDTRCWVDTDAIGLQKGLDVLDFSVLSSDKNKTFHRIQQTFTEFAESNAFHGKEKAMPIFKSEWQTPLPLELKESE